MKTWRQGNLHTHTTNSDGDTPPEHVAGWYEEHGYDWLCISDHNHLTILKDAEAGSKKWPLLVLGEEVSALAGADGTVPVHINAYGIERLVEPFSTESVPETLRENVSRIVRAGGMASINHPNFKWALTADDLLQVDGYRFVEVFNGHPAVNNIGGGGTLGAEAIWDVLLSAGKTVWGLAVDDAHHYTGEFERSGFSGPLNRYRCVDLDWRDFGALRRRPIEIPALFVGGDLDGPTIWGAPAIGRFGQTLPRLHDSLVLEGCGHWVQQEKPDAVNQALVGFLEAVHEGV